MCGIYSYRGTKYSIEQLKQSIDLISYRGPDNSKYNQINDDTIFAFHRLAILGVSELGNQPLKHPEDESLTLICNGEIYNYQKLAKKYNFNLVSGSDCEVILFMFKNFGMERTVKELDGVFMFVLHDAKKNILYASRDPFGVRPGFIGFANNEIFISSESKSINNQGS